MRLSKTLLAVALIALLGATVQAESSQSQDMGIFTAAQFTSMFASFVAKFRKVYSASTFKAKFEVFKANLQKITLFNSQKRSYKMGTNALTDLTPAEFKKLLGLKQLDAGTSFIEGGVVVDGEAEADTEVTAEMTAGTKDWSTGLTEPRFQGYCGSCWAFSTAAFLESHHFSKTNEKIMLSEQELLDCVPRGNCVGGYFDLAAAYGVVKGLALRKDYPYEEYQKTCRSSSTPRSGFKAPSKVKMLARTEAAILAGLQKSALIIGVSGTGNLQFYSSGLIDDCGSTKADHAVLLVSALPYGSDKRDAYKIRNSWGSDWGEKGYFYVPRSNGKTSGTNTTSNSCAIYNYGVLGIDA